MQSNGHGQGAALAVLLTLAAMLVGCSVAGGSAFDNEHEPAAPRLAVEAGPDGPQEVEDPSQPTAAHAAMEERRAMRVTQRPDPPQDDYIIGPHDVLYINVYNRPELSSAQASAEHGRIVGSTVDGSGNIQLPMVGTVHVAGLTASDARQKLQQVFAQYIQDPWVVVEVIEHGSQPIYLIGQFGDPGVKYLDRPTNLVQAIAMGKGVGEDAYLAGARVIRNERVVPVDIYRLLRQGDMDQNIWIRPGDALYVPDDEDLVVFVLGDVEEPGAVPMPEGRLTLTQALSGAGGFETVGSSLEKVRIIRPLSPTRGELITINLKRILTGEALPFALRPGDVVFVPRSALGRWNDTLKEILPSLQAVSGMLEPFVQLLVISDARNDD